MPHVDTKAGFVRENFNKIANKYDQFNDWNSFLLHRIWKNQLVREIEENLSDRLHVMDLCCGTGDISVRLGNSLRVHHITCVDFSENMLEIAKTRLKKQIEKGRVSFEIGDATELKNFRDFQFDAVSIGFGLRNVDDLSKAVREILRILKPGGLFLNLDVGKVKNPWIRWIADFYFFKIVPILGYILWGGKNEMFDYLPVSSLAYPDQENLKSILEKLGFQEVRYKNFVFGNAVLHIAKKPL
ncbi:methionine biosynthesis protein MetW-like protein [Leptospira weilii str. 2006001853]|uniref:Demethylmenaquinone methyltransferase n=5 Tax=Leptospiraceae TaxID=170 RepID=A0A828YTX6_9LEPT|nr:methionine biosynthesis protein MetW-like protein [Leptospira weilii str. 2006001853]EMJ63364.1 methionine biosynthesis protein MetW-like protein [Leptospira sp. P2653]EMM71578.1 methionine biosynthesis protein MetW-like protein [Leptospira weilii str. 2006001855]EMN44555.1 methionine biosynthesis protein MetW-like protein [Leptospira weilii str. LNT 1234]EMN89211.1 methionine biosynthesis protein MetW-like protein [Leptospira weilii str. UI 13098]EMY13664.1 methionine biosynthesis protein 